jgi:hypothetical protein
VVEAASWAPLGSVVDLTLTATYDGGQTVSTFQLVVGQFHFMVWDPTADQSSGPVIVETLSSLGYAGHYSQALPVARLDRYQVLFVSVGIYDGNYVVGQNSPEAMAIVEMLGRGGNVYLEGGDVWYYDPGIGGHNFNALFGLNATGDGTSDMQQVLGQGGTFTEGMSFYYAGENNWMDHIVPIYSAVQIFKNSSPVYGCGVAYDAGGYKTIGTSFEFAGLTDGASPSTKAELAEAIMTFFIGGTVDVEEQGAPLLVSDLVAHPNPFNPATEIHLANAEAGHVALTIYDTSGRRVRTLADEVLAEGPWTFRWDGRDQRGRQLASGVYFLRLDSPALVTNRKLVMLK